MQLKGERKKPLKARTAHGLGGPLDPAILSLGLLNSFLILELGFGVCQAKIRRMPNVYN